MSRRRNKSGAIGIAFALGLLFYCFCPPHFLVTLLAIALILMGIFSCRH